MASNPPDWWDGPKPQQRAAGRVVRLCTDDEEDEATDTTRPTVRPILASDVNGDLLTTKEPAMPKGVYDRKAKGTATPAANDAAKPKKPGRKARALAVVPKVAEPRVNGTPGRFDVSLDLRGGAVTINATSGSLTLAPDEVLALFAFIGRR